MNRNRLKYFAYGSNMLSTRLRERVPSAKSLGKIRLKGHRLAWTKQSFRDGSGKCHIVKTGRSFDVVWGVLYEMHEKEIPDLDRAEGKGYDQKIVTMNYGRTHCQAFTYVATAVKPELHPYKWYQALVVKGAREHHLPNPYIQFLEQVKTRNDPDSSRFDQIARFIE